MPGRGVFFLRLGVLRHDARPAKVDARELERDLVADAGHVGGGEAEGGTAAARAWDDCAGEVDGEGWSGAGVCVDDGACCVDVVDDDLVGVRAGVGWLSGLVVLLIYCVDPVANAAGAVSSGSSFLSYEAGLVLSELVLDLACYWGDEVSSRVLRHDGADFDADLDREG